MSRVSSTTELKPVVYMNTSGKSHGIG